MSRILAALCLLSACEPPPGDRSATAVGRQPIVGGTLDTSIAYQRFHTFIGAQGSGDEIITPEGQQSGLLHDSAVKCERLHTVLQSQIKRTVGLLSAALMQQVDACLKAALGLP